MRDNTMVARRIADRHSAALAVARYLTEKFGLSEDQVEDLIQQYGLGRDKLAAAARRLTD
jgi:hypothetical protein